MTEDRKVICPYCHKEARWVDNKEVYGKRYGKSYMCWYCSDCDAYVGCHNNTIYPLGVMANKELRLMRIKAHHAFDPLWKSGRLRRDEAYETIAHILGRDFHVGESDLETCKEVIEAVKTYNSIASNKWSGGVNKSVLI